VFRNEMPRFEVLSEGALDTVDRGWRRLVSEIGVQFDHPRALELFRAAGCEVEDAQVRFDPDFLVEQAAKAPREFDMRARNPKHDLHIGGDSMIFAPTQGPPFVRTGSTRRDATLADLQRFIMLTQSFPELDTPGGGICEPNDTALDSRHLAMNMSLILLCDKVFEGVPMSDVAAADSVRMGEILFGGREAIEERPVMFANVNVNSPLRYDVRMLEAMLEFSAANQAVIVTPFLLMGAMAPVSVGAALAQQTAEVLAGVALLQLVRPGAPVVMGSFLSSTDMKSGAPAFGTPESAIGLYASGQIARRIGLPWRAGGGTLTASPAVDAQAGYEALNTLMSAFLAGANVVWQAAGWLEGGLVACFEKFMMDVELLKLLRVQLAPTVIDEDALAFGAHQEVGPGGHFFGCEHTLAHFRDCFYRPFLATTDNFDRWSGKGSPTAAVRAEGLWREALERYEAPPLDDAVREELLEFVDRRTRELGDDPIELGIPPEAPPAAAA
jgi:trimethylamine---corrinoid protein Co-methyltransferase